MYGLFNVGSTFWFAWSDIGIDKPNWKSSKRTWQVNL